MQAFIKMVCPQGFPIVPMVGLDWAAALGAFLKNPEKNLELLADVDDDILAKQKLWLKQVKCLSKWMTL